MQRFEPRPHSFSIFVSVPAQDINRYGMKLNEIIVLFDDRESLLLFSPLRKIRNYTFPLKLPISFRFLFRFRAGHQPVRHEDERDVRAVQRHVHDVLLVAAAPGRLLLEVPRARLQKVSGQLVNLTLISSFSLCVTQWLGLTSCCPGGSSTRPFSPGSSSCTTLKIFRLVCRLPLSLTLILLP